MEKNLALLKSVLKWRNSKIATEVGVSAMAVTKWVKGAIPSKDHQDKLGAVVQTNRYYKAPRLNDYAACHDKNHKLTPLRHMLNCGVTYTVISTLTQYTPSQLARFNYDKNERRFTMAAKIFEVLCKLQKAEGEDKPIDLLDTKTKAPYTQTNDPVLPVNPDGDNINPLPDEVVSPLTAAKGKDDNTYQVPW